MDKAIIFCRGKSFAVSSVLIALSLLVIGAAHVAVSMSNEKILREQEKEKWTAVMLAFAHEIPIENSTEWKDLAVREPQLLLMANTRVFCAISEKETF